MQVLWAFLLLPAGLWGQKLPLRHFTTDAEVNPLPVSAILTIQQDKDGFIWMSAYDHGLLRYDGNRFDVYRPELDSVPRNVWSIFQSSNGFLWAAGEDGYRVTTRPIDAFPPGEPLRWSSRYGGVDLPGLAIVDHQVMAEGPEGRIWIAQDSTILRLPALPGPPATADTLRLPLEPEEMLYSLFAGQAGTWLGTSEGRILLIGGQDQTIRDLTRGLPQGDRPHSPTLCFTEVGGTLWGGTLGGEVWRFDDLDGTSTFTIRHLGASVMVKSISADGNGQVLVATREEGIFSFDRETATLRRQFTLADGLLDLAVWDLLRDREGNIWMAQNAGVSRMRADYRAFQWYDATNLGNKPAALPAPGVNVVLPDVSLRPGASPVVLAGTSEGLAAIARDGARKVLTPADGLTSAIILSLTRDPAGRVWIGTNDGLLCLAGSRTLLDLPGAGPPKAIPWVDGRPAYLSVIFPMGFFRYVERFALPGGQDLLLAVGFDRALLYDGSRWYDLGEDAGLASPNNIRGAVLTANGTLLLSDKDNGLLSSRRPLSVEGLARASAPRAGQAFGKEVFPVRERLVDEHPLLWQGDTLSPTGAIARHDDQVWLAAREGLFALAGPDPEPVARRSRVVEGRERYQFSSLFAERGTDRLWAGSQHGLFLFDPKDPDQVRQVDRGDGLAGDQVWGPQSLRVSREGEVLYGSPLGLTRYWPERDATLKIPPRPVFRKVAFQEDAWGNNSIQFEYSALSFALEGRNRYRSRLRGYDKAWSADTSSISIRYTNLPAVFVPRSYTFELEAANADGVWSQEPLTYSFRVNPPWWLRWWALLLVLAVLGLMIRLYIRQRLRAQEKELEKERRISDRLREVDRLKDQFLANTSHELRTPLNGIIGLAESLMDGIAGTLPRKAVHNLDMISSSGRRLANLVNDILDFSRLKNQELTLKLAPVDLYAATDVVITLLEPLIKDKPVTLENRIPRDGQLVRADEDRLQQILQNLLGNAIKFTPGGQVIVTAETKDDMVEVHVRDTGIGIEKDKQDTIFQSFQQADGDIARSYGGTGLGLTITRQLVELHGGTVRLRSTPGEGSDFWFTLPKFAGEAVGPTPGTRPGRPVARRLPEEATSETAVPAKPVGGQAQPDRILIVDDEAVNLEVLDNHLTLAGYEVVRAGDGRQALDALTRQGPIDLVLLDIMMPQMSGFEVCRKIREKWLPSALPVVMVTAKNQVSDLVYGFEAGANDYISKPFAKDELLSRVQTHLRLKRIHTATGKFVPHEFLRSIGRETIMEAKLGDQTEREVTVLFSDIRDYTTLSESMTPDQTFRFVNAYNQRIGPLIRENRGFVNQYLGDAIMALFPEKPTDALRAAVAMQQRLAGYNAERRKRGRLPIRSGIGIHSGSLIMGIIGDEDRLDAATISDTVNTAARLESLTKHYQAGILLSETTLRHKDPDFQFQTRYLGQVQVKGRQATIRIYEGIDGDEPELRDLKLATLAQFREACEAFYAMHFEEASRIFAEITQRNPGDGPALRFLRRAQRYLTKGVPEDWTGIEVMERK